MADGTLRFRAWVCAWSVAVVACARDERGRDAAAADEAETQLQDDAHDEADVRAEGETQVAPDAHAEADVRADVETQVVPDAHDAADAGGEADARDVGETAVDGGDDAVSASDVLGPVDFTRCEASGAERVPLPEASGAALLDAAGTRILLVADSGNAGSALVMDLAAALSRQVTLPLGGGGDDVEGLERTPDGRVAGLTSAGWLLIWREVGDTFELASGPTVVSDDPAWACEATGVNCAANFEGLCLHPAPEAGACAGWAASKARGELVCLRVVDGRYVLDPNERVAITEPERLSGCAFEPEPPHRLIAAGNVYAGSALWLVERRGGAPVVTELDAVGPPNQEAVLVRPGGELHTFGDAQGLLPGQSPHAWFVCR